MVWGLLIIINANYEAITSHTHNFYKHLFKAIIWHLLFFLEIVNMMGVLMDILFLSTCNKKIKILYWTLIIKNFGNIMVLTVTISFKENIVSIENQT